MTLDGLIYALVAVIPFHNKYIYLYSVVSSLTLLFCDRHLIINHTNIQTATTAQHYNDIMPNHKVFCSMSISRNLIVDALIWNKTMNTSFWKPILCRNTWLLTIRWITTITAMKWLKAKMKGKYEKESSSNVDVDDDIGAFSFSQTSNQLYLFFHFVFSSWFLLNSDSVGTNYFLRSSELLAVFLLHYIFVL